MAEISLYELGTEHVAWVAGFSSGPTGEFTYQSKEVDHLLLGAGAGNSEQRTYVTDTPIDLTNVSVVKVRWTQSGQGNNTVQAVHLIASTSKTGDHTAADAIFTDGGGWAERENEIDVSALSGDHYIRVHARCMHAFANTVLQVYEVSYPTSRTFDLLRSSTSDVADAVVVQSGPSLSRLDNPGQGTWRYWVRADEDGFKSDVIGPTDPVVIDLLPIMRGVNVNGGEFGAGSNIGAGSGGTFSNANPGTYGTDYRYELQASLDYVASRGNGFIRLPFRWERLMPGLPSGNLTLDSTELTRLVDAVDRVNAAGMTPAVACFNYGAYWVESGGVGVRTTITYDSVTTVAFGTLWHDLAQALVGKNVVYALMNEPIRYQGGAYVGTNAEQGAWWEAIAQHAVDRIREVDTTHIIAVPTNNWSTVIHVNNHHPGGPWVVDAIGLIVYEAHHYLAYNYDASYDPSYDVEEVKFTNPPGDFPDSMYARAYDDLTMFTTWLDGAPGWIGETAMLDSRHAATATDTNRYNALLDWYLSLCDQRRLWVTGWACGSFWSQVSGTTLIYNRSQGSSVLDMRESTAPVYEAHLSGAFSSALDDAYERPEGWRDFTPLDVSAGGDFVLLNDTDYLIANQAVTGSWVRLRGGRKVVVMGLTVNHDEPWSSVESASELNSTGLELQENPFDSGDPQSGGELQAEAEFYIEGLLSTGPRLTQGMRLNCQRDVRVRNWHVDPVTFKNCDHRDGTNGLTTNHPDILQTYNDGFKSLTIDGLTGYTGYQGIFLRATSTAGKVVVLRNIDVRAVEFASEEQDATSYNYAGHRILSNVDGFSWTVDNVWVDGHPNNGWGGDPGFQRVRYWDGATYVEEPPSGTAVDADAVFPAPDSSGSDGTGDYVEWVGVGRVYLGSPPAEFVPANKVGAEYDPWSGVSDG